MSLNGFIFVSIIFLIPSLVVANDDIKELSAERITVAPKIDGVLDDIAWKDLSDALQFYEFKPNNGQPSAFTTQIKVVYTDYAIFVAARLNDPSPDKILRELGIRDDDGKNSDIFGFSIDTYKNGQNAFNFFVTAAGVQVDYYVSNESYDYNWDAVWNSAIKIDEQGWVVEFEIPLYSLRFPQKKEQVWGINFYRKVQRLSEESYWNHVDNSKQGYVNQFGILTGINNIKPPLRLSFSPYISTVYAHDGISRDGAMAINGGMDLKYGINESFTLDLSLIPDFSQVRSDDQVLNLSPFEVQFSENRPFFTENIDIFSRNGLFYTRRVGQSMGKAYQDEANMVVNNVPGHAPLINALKISGRTKGGTGLGLFNAITNKTYANVLVPDTLGGFEIDPDTGERKYNIYREGEKLYDPLTNYNVFVIDQNLKNNSSIGLINTNVTRSDGVEDANVTGMDFKINDKSNTYRVNGSAAVNTIYDNSGAAEVGHAYYLYAGKISGKWQYGISRNFESSDYNINDLGYLRSANEVSHSFQLSYNIFKPFGKFNGMYHSIGGTHMRYDEPEVFSTMNIYLNGEATLKNFWNVGYFANVIPFGDNDYFESRTMEPFDQPWAYNYEVWFSTDSRKPFFVNMWGGRWFRPDWEQADYWIGEFIRYRLNNKLSLTHEMGRTFIGNDIGYVYIDGETRQDNSLPSEMIIFGGRDISNTENMLGINYTFTNKMGLNLRVRHLWSKVIYLNFYELEDDGDIRLLDYSGHNTNTVSGTHDINFNAFNLDMNFVWQVAPGSFFTVTWKNASLFQNNKAQPNFFENINTVVKEPHNNNLSFRLTYFIDYLTLRNTIKSKV